MKLEEPGEWLVGGGGGGGGGSKRCFVDCFW